MAADRLALFFIGDRVLVGNALFAAKRVGEDDPGATLGTFEALVDQLVDIVAELGLDLSSRSHVPGGLCEAEGVDGGRNASLIRTLRGDGYMLVVPVSKAED